MNKSHTRYLAFSLLFYTLLCVFFNTISWQAFTNFALDDAWIHQVYAHSLAFGHGFAYNVPGPQETGFTSPLWAIVCAPLEWLSVISPQAVVVAVKVLGYSLGAISLTLIFAISQSLQHHRGASMLACIITSLSSVFLFALFSGMENSLLICLWLAITYCLATQREQLAALFVGLATITRPEAVLLWPFYFFIVYVLTQQAFSWKRFAVIVALSVGPFLLWMCYCYAATGHVFPNTYYIKSGVNARIMQNNRLALWNTLHTSDYARSGLFYVLIAATGITLSLEKKPRSTIIVLLLLIAPCAYLLGVISTRHVYSMAYYFRRYLNPAIIMLFIFFALGLAHSYHYRRWLGIVLTISSMIIFLIPQLSLVSTQRIKLALANISIEKTDVNTGKWLAKHTPKTAIIGSNDAGAIRYFSHRRVIDLMGLNNHNLAHRSHHTNAIISSITWLSIFPSWQQQFKALGTEPDMQQFTHITTIGMDSHKDYMICTPINSFNTHCPNQYQVLVYKRQQDQ